VTNMLIAAPGSLRISAGRPASRLTSAWLGSVAYLWPVPSVLRNGSWLGARGLSRGSLLGISLRLSWVSASASRHIW
jgi:hypothetical protein